jgi:formylglycine-generating enzyme
MDKIIEAVVQLIPISKLFELAGLGKELNAALSLLVSAILIYAAVSGFNKLQSYRKAIKAANNLKPYFDYKSILGLSRLYIQTKASRMSPNRFANPDEVYKHETPFSLIPFMLKKSFNEKVESEKFYLLLADSGMGKTSFMVNLYLKNYSLLNYLFGKKYDMRLLRFQSPDQNNPVDVLERLKNIKEDDVSETILLLDGLDEDPYIFSKDKSISDEEAFNKRIHAIVTATWMYKDVVLTCRTQYFPQQENQDYELKVKKPDGKGFYKFQKYYVYPFSKSDIRNYLQKKYGVLNIKNIRKKKIAQQVANNNSTVMARPMLMSYIDDLVVDNKIYANSWEIFEVLIDKWLKRESEKCKEESKRAGFIDNLRKLSKQVALDIYNTWITEGILHISKERSIEIAEQYNIPLKPDEVIGKSLLTCDANLNWKFSHKSILEFFLAKEARENLDFAMKLDFAGMDMVKLFCSEEIKSSLLVSSYVHIKGKEFLMGSPDREADRQKNETQHSVQLSDYYICKYAVTVSDFSRFIAESNYQTEAEKQNSSRILDGEKWVDKEGINCRHGLSGAERLAEEQNHPVLHVSWNDAKAYCVWLSSKTGKIFRLPTEAEWEYACRAWTTTPFSMGENLTTKQANYDGNYPYKKHPKGEYRRNTVSVESLEPNAWGLYNMHGNVWEWCSDWYDENYYEECKSKGTVENPIGSATGSFRVLRGGSWYNYAVHCRSAFRNYDTPGNRFSYLGFRLVFVP